VTFPGPGKYVFFASSKDGRARTGTTQINVQKPSGSLLPYLLNAQSTLVIP
jgi:hypothetical protein